MLLILLACDGNPKESAAPAGDSDTGSIPESYLVDWRTDPDPLSAGEAGVFTLQVTDQDGRPVEDLQQSHQRMIHSVFVSADLATFQHLHHEDYADITADDLRAATYRFPITLPTSGAYAVGFDYAHRNRYLHTDDSLSVGGAAPQLDSPDLTEVTSVVTGGVRFDLAWVVSPIAGYESAWSVTLSDAQSGEPVTDLQQWLGADAHVVMAPAALGRIDHSHAWFPGMENAPPGHDMPHQYSGPEVPFHYTFPEAGAWKMWIQCTRASDPDNVLTAPFVFTVSP